MPGWSDHTVDRGTEVNMFMNLKIGARLSIGFGALIVMMLVMVAVGLMRFSEVNTVNSRIIEKDWVKAEAC